MWVWPNIPYKKGGLGARSLTDSRIGNPSVGDPRIQDASANNFSGSRIKWGLEDTRTFQGSKNQWDLENWKTIEGLKIWAKFEDLRRRNLHVLKTACQREMHEYGDQNVTKVLVHWKISFNEDANHNNTLWTRCFEGEGNDVKKPYRYIDNNFCNVAFN